MDPRYPIGKFEAPKEVMPAMREQAIQAISELPAKLRAAVSGLNAAQVDTPYRDGGWTVRQVTHHVADSHMNAFVRFRLALTEDAPTIKPYDEKLWAELADSKTAPPEISLALTEALHDRWVRMLRPLNPADYARRFVHPEHGARTLEWMLFLYAWHGRHHTAHVTALRQQKSW